MSGTNPSDAFHLITYILYYIGEFFAGKKQLIIVLPRLRCNPTEKNLSIIQYMYLFDF